MSYLFQTQEYLVASFSDLRRVPGSLQVTPGHITGNSFNSSAAREQFFL